MEAEVVTLQDLSTFDYRAGMDADGRFLGTLQPTGLRPRFLEGLAAHGITLPPSTFMTGPR
jgi:pilus assembly protein CpaF